MSTNPDDLIQVAQEILRRFQYKHRGYGYINCTSCGAEGCEDYGEDRVRTTVEPCSKSCPWRRLKELISD